MSFDQITTRFWRKFWFRVRQRQLFFESKLKTKQKSFPFCLIVSFFWGFFFFLSFSVLVFCFVFCFLVFCGFVWLLVCVVCLFFFLNFVFLSFLFKTIFFKKNYSFYFYNNTLRKSMIELVCKKAKDKNTKLKTGAAEGRDQKKKRFSNQWDFQTREIVSLWSSQGWFKRGRQPLFWVFLFFLWHTTTKKGILNTKRIDLIWEVLLEEENENKQHISLWEKRWRKRERIKKKSQKERKGFWKDERGKTYLFEERSEIRFSVVEVVVGAKESVGAQWLEFSLFFFLLSFGRKGKKKKEPLNWMILFFKIFTKEN